MNVPETALKDLDGSLWLGVLVRTGLVAFSAGARTEADPVLSALARESGALGGSALPGHWPDLLATLQGVWPLRGGAIGELIADLELTPVELFVLGLAGGVEDSHPISLLLDRLQAPAGGARPSVHLALAMVDELFGPAAMDVHALQGMSLVGRGVLELEGDGPLPLRSLRIHPVLWSVLNGHRVLWPGCRELENRSSVSGSPFFAPDDVDPNVEGPSPRQSLLPRSLLEQIPKLADLIVCGELCGLVLRGSPGSGRALFAGELARAAGLKPLEVSLELWTDEPALGVAARYGGWLPVLRPHPGPGELWEPPLRRDCGPLVFLLGADGAVAGEGLMELALPMLPELERRALWRQHLGNELLAGEAANALLGGPVIVALAGRARLLAQRDGEPPGLRHIAAARSLLGAERLRLLAQPVERKVTKAALVMPPTVAAELDAAIARARQRESVLDGLGVTLKATPNPGVRLLLVGESGTGKTLIASYLATALGAPLYRVDLAAVMNKYIGESEKNLGALLDQAAAHDVVLLFDEADSLFGRRTERKETGERFANMLTNFLLTRIETHPGIVVLTTNSRERIDNAFTRRLDQIVEVPLPGYEERLDLWRSHLGERGPGDAACGQLAGYCDLAGGQIRNVVLTASALAAGAPIGLAELVTALRGEYRKLGRGLPAQVERMDGGDQRVVRLADERISNRALGNEHRP